MIVKCPKCWVTVSILMSEVANDYAIEVLDCPEVIHRQRRGGSTSNNECETLNRAFADATALMVRGFVAVPLVTKIPDE
jgi:hypothetical protein